MTTPPALEPSSTCRTEHKSWLGIDVGGSTIGGSVVNLTTGARLQRVSEPTPKSATPAVVAAIVNSIARQFRYSGAIGCAMPGVLDGDRLANAPNLAPEWDRPGSLSLLQSAVEGPVDLLNDADAAGLSEARFGDLGDTGLTILLTFGTGIGSALVHGGTVIRNTELGLTRGEHGSFEDAASGSSVSNQRLSPDVWAERTQPYFDHLEHLLNPAAWIISGGLSNDFDRYFSLLATRSPMRMACFGPDAGVVGAAIAAETLSSKR